MAAGADLQAGARPGRRGPGRGGRSRGVAGGGTWSADPLTPPRPWLRCGPPCPARASMCGERVHARKSRDFAPSRRSAMLGRCLGSGSPRAPTPRRQGRCARRRPPRCPDRRARRPVTCSACSRWRCSTAACAQIGYALQFAGPVAAIVWLPVGIGVAFLYLGGLRYWPGVLIGDLLANDYAALPLGSALGQTAGNVLEVLVVTVLLRRLVPRGDPLGSVGGVSRMLRRDRGRNRGQRLGRVGLAAARRRDRRRRGPGGVAHLVARRRVGRAASCCRSRSPGRSRRPAAGGSAAAPRPALMLIADRRAERADAARQRRSSRTSSSRR